MIEDVCEEACGPGMVPIVGPTINWCCRDKYNCGGCCAASCFDIIATPGGGDCNPVVFYCKYRFYKWGHDKWAGCTGGEKFADMKKRKKMEKKRKKEEEERKKNGGKAPPSKPNI